MYKKRLCLVVASLNTGGMERVMSELANYFAGKEHVSVHLVLYGKEPETFYQLKNNIIIHRPSAVFKDKFRTWHTFKRLFYLRKEIQNIRPDTVLSFGEYWNSFVLLALFGLKYPVFVSDRCQPDKSLGIIHDKLRKILYPRAKGVIVQTNVAKEIYKKILPKANIHVIGNPIRSIPVDHTIKKENIVLSVGRLISSKHHDELIKLFVKINAPGWKLFIVGGDAQKQKNFDKLNVLINELNAKDKVVLTELRKDVDNFYKKSKIFAFTSSSEGFPNVIGEAMSAGLPVVAFDCVAGPSEMIEDGKTGYLVSLFDYDTFEKRLGDLTLDEALQKEFGKKGQQKIKEFSVNKISEKFYQTILNT